MISMVVEINVCIFHVNLFKSRCCHRRKYFFIWFGTHFFFLYRKCGTDQMKQGKEVKGESKSGSSIKNILIIISFVIIFLFLFCIYQKMMFYRRNWGQLKMQLIVLILFVFPNTQDQKMKLEQQQQQKLKPHLIEKLFIVLPN